MATAEWTSGKRPAIPVMPLLMRLVILSLPLVGFPRLGPIKLIDVLLCILIPVVWITEHGRVRVHRSIPLLGALLAASTFYGFLLINFFHPIQVLGGWNTGLESQKAYGFIAFAQTMLYIYGTYLVARYIHRNQGTMVPFLYRSFVGYQILFILLFFVPFIKPFITNEGIFLKSTFTEKGPMGSFFVFIYAYLMTYYRHTHGQLFSRKAVVLLQIVTVLTLLLSVSTAGAAVFLVFNFFHYCVNRSVLNSKYISVLAVGGVAITPFFFMLSTKVFRKIHIFLSYLDMAPEQTQGAIGRFAALILLPRIFKSYPLFGVGYGNYIFYRTSMEFAYFLPIIKHDSSSNFYMHVLMEMGLVGLLALMWLMAIHPLLTAFKKRNENVLAFHVAFLVYLMISIPAFWQCWFWFFAIQCFLAPSPSKELEGKPIRVADA